MSDPSTIKCGSCNVTLYQEDGAVMDPVVGRCERCGTTTFRKPICDGCAAHLWARYREDRDRDVSGRSGMEPGARVEVRYPGPGGWGWRPATVKEGRAHGGALVVFDDPPTGHPSWDALAKNIRAAGGPA